MLAINIDDVLNVLTTVAPYLIGFGIVLVIAIIAMIACKKQSKAKKYMVRSQAGMAILLAFGIVANLIAFGPMSTMISLAFKSLPFSYATGKVSIISCAAWLARMSDT